MKTMILCAAAACLASTASANINGAAWSPEDGDVIAFDVLRKGKPFGEHVISFDVSDDGTVIAKTNVSLRAGFGPITVFKYELSSEETWRDNALVALTGRLVENGDEETVEATLKDGSLVVDGTAYSGDAPSDIIPSSHWNIREISGERMLSTENGEIIEFTVETLGTETLDIGGAEIETTKYLLDSDIDVELWYDDQGRWLKLAFEARGQTIEYRLRDLYD